MRIVAMAALVALAAGASAQTLPSTDAARRSLDMSERNHLGLLEYCAGRGFIDDSAVTLQRALVGRLPPFEGQALEASGRRGVIELDTPQGTFAISAAAQGITERFSCEQTALRTLRQQGASPPR